MFGQSLDMFEHNLGILWYINVYYIYVIVCFFLCHKAASNLSRYLKSVYQSI